MEAKGKDKTNEQKEPIYTPISELTAIAGPKSTRDFVGETYLGTMIKSLSIFCMKLKRNVQIDWSDVEVGFRETKDDDNQIWREIIFLVKCKCGEKHTIISFASFLQCIKNNNI